MERGSDCVRTSLVILLVVSTLVISACSQEKEADRKAIDIEDAYTRCTGICASVITDDYTLQWLCYDECKKKFLMNSTNSS